MFPEQYQGWSLVSLFPAERSDYKTTALLVLSLSGPWPILYFCHWNRFHQDRKKIPPCHPCSTLCFLWQPEECQKLTSLCSHYSIFRTAFFSWWFLKSSPSYPHLSPPPTHTHRGWSSFIVHTALERVIFEVDSFFFLLISVTVFHFFSNNFWMSIFWFSLWFKKK